MSPRTTRLRALVGLLVGAVWEGVGRVYLWKLRDPEWAVFLLAMFAWPALGVLLGAALDLAGARAPGCKSWLKPLVAPVALATAALTREMGLLQYPRVAWSVGGVPLYMVTGMTTLVYVLDAAVPGRRSRVAARGRGRPGDLG